jgi:large subunit ribosomal protein L25
MSGVGEHALITLQLSEEGASSADLPVLVKDYQRDPVSEELLHVDFIQVSLKEVVIVTVPVEIVKMPASVKLGGILQQQLREIEIECLPTEIPSSITVDAEDVAIGHSLHVSDLGEQKGFTITTDPSEVILSVSAPVVEEVAEEEEEAAAEPELVKAKGKEEEDEKKAEEK